MGDWPENNKYCLKEISLVSYVKVSSLMRSALSSSITISPPVPLEFSNDYGENVSSQEAQKYYQLECNKLKC